MAASAQITIDRVFHCTAEELFRYLVEPRLISGWFGPKHLQTGRVETDPRMNGQYQIELLRPDGKSIWITGRYLEIEPPKKLKMTLMYRGSEVEHPDSTVEITLVSTGIGSTRLHLVQSFEQMPQDIDNRTHAWEFMFARLQLLFDHQPG